MGKNIGHGFKLLGTILQRTKKGKEVAASMAFSCSIMLVFLQDG